MRLSKVLLGVFIVLPIASVMTGCGVASALGSGPDPNSKLSKSVSTKLQITSTTLPAALKDTGYSANLVATGGTTPYVWKLLNTLPAGLTLSSTGTLQGTPTTVGNFTFNVKVFDSRENSTTKSIALAVTSPATTAPLIMATSTLPSATAGKSYSTTLSASGGVLPYTWFANGTIPAGLAVSSNGVLSGTPTTAGTFTVPVKVVDAENTVQTVTANLPLSITNPLASTAPADFTVSASPSSQSVLQGGAGTFALALSPTNSFSGSVSFTTSGLPSGMSVNYGSNPVSLSSSTNVNVALSTTASTPTGTYTVTTTATSGSLTHTASFAVTVTSNSTSNTGTICGVNSDGTTIFMPDNYGTMPMPGIGSTNAVIDSQYGCPVWKVADMSMHDAGTETIDSQDRWIVTKTAVPQTVGYWGKNSTIIRDLHTGAAVCQTNVTGGGWVWGAKSGDQDNLYYHVAPAQIWKVNIPACINAGGIANNPGPAVSMYDDLASRTGWTNLSWCQDASDFSVDGDHLCIGQNAGGYLLDPRVYTVSTKHIGPAAVGSPHQPPSCPNASVGSCYRGAWLSPLKNNLVLAYYTTNNTTYLDLFDGGTGAYQRTLTDYNSHGSIASWNGEEYQVNAVNGLDPLRPANCSPGIQAIRFSDGVHICLLNLKGVGAPGTTGDYQEAHMNGRGTDGGNPYIAVDVIDYMYGITNFTTFANLPRPGAGYAAITDAVAPGNCTAGGGTSFAYCIWNGTTATWESAATGSFPTEYDYQSHWGPYFNEIYVVNLDGSVARHMVHHRSMSVENYYAHQKAMGNVSPYWSSPRVVVSRSGKYMIWDSTWGGNDNISIYASQIK